MLPMLPINAYFHQSARFPCLYAIIFVWKRKSSYCLDNRICLEMLSYGTFSDKKKQKKKKKKKHTKKKKTTTIEHTSFFFLFFFFFIYLIHDSAICHTLFVSA